MKHIFPFQKQNNSFFYEAPNYSLRKQSNKIGFLLCASIAAMYLFSYALQLVFNWSRVSKIHI